LPCTVQYCLCAAGRNENVTHSVKVVENVAVPIDLKSLGSLKDLTIFV